MRLIRELMQVPACAISLAAVGGVISLVTAMLCEEVGLIWYQSIWDSVHAWLRALLLGATAGGLSGFVWSARRCSWRLRPVLEADDEVW